VGKTKVGGIDFNKPRMRWVASAVLALAGSPDGFTASQLAERVRIHSRDKQFQYGPRRAAHDLKKLRGKQIVSRIGKTPRYEVVAEGLRTVTALVVLREKILIKPLLAAQRIIGEADGPETRHQSRLITTPFEPRCAAYSRS
jgi:hypothetical protein